LESVPPPSADLLWFIVYPIVEKTLWSVAEDAGIANNQQAILRTPGKLRGSLALK
jgi:hypothetical protein